MAKNATQRNYPTDVLVRHGLHSSLHTGGFCHNICLYYHVYHNYVLKHPTRHISDTFFRFLPKRGGGES